MKLLLTICCATVVVVNLSFAESADQQAAVNAELLKEMKALEAKVATLEKRLEHYENGEVRSERTASAHATKKSSDKTALISAENNVGSTTSETSTTEDNSSVKTPLFGLGYLSNAILSIGAYGELKFGGQQAPG